MVFMISTSPTSSEINATTSNKVLISCVIEGDDFRQLGHCADFEIVLHSRFDFVSVLQRFRDLLDGRFQCLRVTAGFVTLIRSTDTIFYGRPRREDDVVLVHPRHIDAFTVKKTDNAKRNIVDANVLADGQAVGKQVFFDRMTDDADLVVSHIFACRDFPSTDIKI